MKDIAILTEKRYLKSKSNNWYIQNILKEDHLIEEELKKLNITCHRVAWDEDFNLSSFRFALFRTTWNYFDQFCRFNEFLRKCNGRISLINPHNQIIWNLNKNYLLDLNCLGINIPETYIVKKKTSLVSFCSKKNLKNIVVKPCVSAAAWKTYHLEGGEIDDFEINFNNLVSKQEMMIQSFQKNIITRGEISLMMIGGKYSHAVLKKAKPGDFRVQDDFGGSVSSHTASFAEIKFAETVIQSLSFDPIYARVDIILDNNNAIALSELELIEPEMWFRLNPDSAAKMASTIRRYINKSPAINKL